MPKRHLDALDLAAEREGAAVRLGNSQICKPYGHGRSITKQRRMQLDGEKKIECRTVKGSFTRYSHL
jgi:hypothetical protein